MGQIQLIKLCMNFHYKDKNIKIKTGIFLQKLQKGHYDVHFIVMLALEIYLFDTKLFSNKHFPIFI